MSNANEKPGKYFGSNITKTMDAYVLHKKPAVTYVPTVSGGIGTQALRHFYEHHFLGKLPPSMRIRLLSRTTGADRVVDELYVSFEHSQEIPWMLPGVPPTNKRVEIIIVSIVSLRGGRLYSEHTYWDQASVLVQVGLLDPKLVPQSAQGVDRLPVVGREAARRILHEYPEEEQVDYHNRMIRRARALRNRSTRASHAGDESAAEFKSEAETPMPVREKKKGKSVQEKGDPGPEQTDDKNGTADESNGNADDEDEAVTETESTAKAKSGPADHKAFVEEGSDENGQS
jgi:hypothetical protein